ncbi:MAG: C4-type zinc ribbon domain-containing protein [Paludibacteraceae bacterium]|jgi:hypothetical protein|nr:hypothetical protein [Paludibacteraceae bacterium]MDD5997710.1 C4-type zinc ribbon domain-containing protein [Bacteroidales bacterium]MBP5524951.1 hypothetical protein [Paludibacteraceae bacterium]MBS7364142.1 hypothetical protein [Paludibacteraceae bacterium]MCR5246493.1 hypothetical protein [Paludibacteraceae bacterium]
MAEAKEITVEEKLKKLYDLQKVMSQIDNLRAVRGELPLEVKDLEDEVAGLETRIANLDNDIKDLNFKINRHKSDIDLAKGQMKKYQDQQNTVRNNREYDNLAKEIEYQGLEIQLSEKRIKEGERDIENKTQELKSTEEYLQGRKQDLDQKREELTSIIADTRAEEEKLMEKAEKLENKIDERLLSAFKRIRKNARNGLSVVTVQRDACGGCFNRIPPQRIADIRTRKRVIVCEYCGRILVDPEINEKKKTAAAE